MSAVCGLCRIIGEIAQGHEPASCPDEQDYPRDDQGRTFGDIMGELLRYKPETPVFDDAPTHAPEAGEPRSIAMAADDMDASITAELPRQRDILDVSNPRPITQPTTEAQLRAASESISPSELLPVPSNTVESVEEAAASQAGRYAPAKPVNERGELERLTVKNYMGVDVPKVGPVDMVGWLRTQGGLKDQGGELSHMGLTNSARKGIEHVGQEQRFGPLVNNEGGMNLDDAAQAAWERGYFPDHTERPTVNEFLDALRSTHEGRARNFLPEDFEQLDRYAATQAERFDLEQQLQDGPVFTDRSVPADGPAPFPPPEAFEDWGSNAPDFAGNIRLDKLETPQDIARALVQTERRVGFDAATRGKVTQAETARLADELGMTPETLLSRRKGQAWNAEEALAARQILAKAGNELVNAARKVQALEEPGHELLADFRRKWMRHVAIQEQISGATAEAGRALAQFRMVANSGAVNRDVLSSIVKGGGGNDNLKSAADTLLEAVETSPGKFNVTAKDLTKPTWQNRFNEYYVNMLLTGPQTHVVNMVSNTLTSMAQLPEHALAGAIGKARQLLPNAVQDRITHSEVGARAFGLIQGAKEGAKMFGRPIPASGMAY